MDGTPPTSPPAAVRRCAGLILTILMLLAAGPAPARAAGDPALAFPAAGPALRTAMDVAHAHWAALPCRGAVTEHWVDLARSVNAQARWSNSAGQWARPELNTDCEIRLNRRADWDWPKLCTVVVHEVGHLLGHDHADDARDVMYAYYVQPVADCLAEPQPASGPGPSVGAPTAPRAKPAAKRRHSARRTAKRRAGHARTHRRNQANG